IADSDHDGAGAIVASTRGTSDIDFGATDANPSFDPTLVLSAGSGIGSANALRTSGATRFELVARSTTGDLRLVQTSGAGAIAVSPLATDAAGLPSGGIDIAGNLELRDDTGGFVLRGTQVDPANPTAHVQTTSGSQTWTGPVKVAADAMLVA